MFDVTGRRGTDPDTAVEPAAGGSVLDVRSARVLELVELWERVESELLEAVGAWDGDRAWEVDGAGSPVAWLSHRGAITRATAARLVRSARLARCHDRVGKALAVGDVKCEHVELMGRAARHRETAFGEHVGILVDAAEALPPEQFRHVARRWCALADDLSDPPPGDERRWLRTAVTFRGSVHVQGLLDPEGGATLLAALGELEQPPGADSYSAAERRADALVALAAGAGRGSGRARVGIDVVVDVDTLIGRPPADLAAVHCDVDGVGPVTSRLVDRLACDAEVARVLVRGRSEVLDLGRRTRVVSSAQRRALVLRDRGCGFPGCTAPHDWCDAHHVVHWLHGGPTDLANLVLLCRRHHVLVHEGGWCLSRAPDGRIVRAYQPPQAASVTPVS